MNKADITGKTISSFTLYKFVQDLTRPFTTFPAYHMGLIDRDGYFTVPVDEIPSSISTFDLFIIYIKRLFDQIPNPATSSKLKSATSAQRSMLLLHLLISALVIDNACECNPEPFKDA